MAGTTNRETHEEREKGFGVRSLCINGRRSLIDPSTLLLWPFSVTLCDVPLKGPRSGFSYPRVDLERMIAFKQLDKLSCQFRVELAAGTALQFRYSFACGGRLAVRAIMGYGVIGINQSENTARQRDGCFFQSLRVALAVPAFMMADDPVGNRFKIGNGLSHAIAYFRMLFHDRPFFFRERAWLK